MAALSFSLTSISKTPKLSPSKTPTTKSTILNLLPYKLLNLNKFSTISKPNSFSLTVTKPSKNPKPKSHFQPISIAVNGTCLTVTDFTNQDFTVGLSPETLRKTSLIELKTGSLVNLERAVQPISRMGGHFVQGHVDGTGVIVEKVPEGDSLWIKVKTEKGLLKYIVPKGFIAVDGTSLTVVDVFEEEGCFNFMLVSYTQQKIVVPLKEVGQKVNLEVDILGKYVESEETCYHLHYCVLARAFWQYLIPSTANAVFALYKGQWFASNIKGWCARAHLSDAI
ncbi:hypothetical protein D5086_025013 [Populus alba]|uniref:Uncharacterized protein n=1 Tax=Populus alba TaxID=43335 RepID=A0ACC4B746_POPAL